MLQTKFFVNRGKWKKLSPLIWGLPSWDGGTIICLTPVIKLAIYQQSNMCSYK